MNYRSLSLGSLGDANASASVDSVLAARAYDVLSTSQVSDVEGLGRDLGTLGGAGACAALGAAPAAPLCGAIGGAIGGAIAGLFGGGGQQVSDEEYAARYFQQVSPKCEGDPVCIQAVRDASNELAFGYVFGTNIHGCGSGGVCQSDVFGFPVGTSYADMRQAFLSHVPPSITPGGTRTEILHQAFAINVGRALATARLKKEYAFLQSTRARAAAITAKYAPGCTSSSCRDIVSGTAGLWAYESGMAARGLSNQSVSYIDEKYGQQINGFVAASRDQARNTAADTAQAELQALQSHAATLAVDRTQVVASAAAEHQRRNLWIVGGALLAVTAAAYFLLPHRK